MQRVLLLGGGKIGRMIARFLTNSGDYQVCVCDYDDQALDRLKHLVDVETKQLDASDQQQLTAAINQGDVVISALSFRFNPLVAQVALDQGASYFDLTEDIETTRAVRKVAQAASENQVFMPQCGLAPGFISIVAYHLIQQLDEIDTVHMRVGALPQFPSNMLKYNLTWSTDGLINEYCNPCEAIENGRHIEVLPLEGEELFSLDGIRYEAFNTSGGLGTLCETLAGKVRELNYRTVRYQGHRHLMKLLVSELRLSEKRDLLKQILEESIPVTFQDVVITFCSVTGKQKGQLVQINDARKIYHQEVDGQHWSAIQLTTAAGICTAVDLHREGKLPSRGFVRQEDVEFQDFINNRFGKLYQSQISTRFNKLSSGTSGEETLGETNE